MLAMPSATPYDLRFRALGIPVRVHPLFWVVMALLGGLGAHGRTVQDVVIWTICGFISILVHEYGHGLMSRAFGFHPSISLYWMGGLCTSEGDRQTPWQRLAVLSCGPGAGLVLAGLFWFGAPLLAERGLRFSPAGVEFVNDMITINLLWSLLNLLPIYPLDGGQIAGVIFTKVNRYKGMQWTHILSLVVAGVAAIWMYQKYQSIVNALLFASLAVTNLQLLQALREYSHYDAYGDDADFWKR
jgi:Zn-dependent protease